MVCHCLKELFMKKVFGFLTLMFVILGARPIFACDNPASIVSPFLQTTSSWNFGNGSSFGIATQSGLPASFTSGTSAGVLINQSNTAALSSLNGGSAWSKSVQDFKGGSDGFLTMNLANGQSGNINVASGQDFSAGIGNSSLVQSGRNTSAATAGVVQLGSGAQSMSGTGNTWGSGQVGMSASAAQSFTGTAAASTSAGQGSNAALGSATQNIGSGLSVGMSTTTNGPGAANGSFNSSQNTFNTQTVTLTGTAQGHHQ